MLPDAPIVHPALGGYPCPDLCAAGVASSSRRRSRSPPARDPADADEDLDLVALATVADLVPLRGENRRLVRAGLRALARPPSPGLRALMRVARVDPASSTRAPSASASRRASTPPGRLHRADAGLELLLTDDEARARRVAEELDAANAERRASSSGSCSRPRRRSRELGTRAGLRAGGRGLAPRRDRHRRLARSSSATTGRRS